MDLDKLIEEQKKMDLDKLLEEQKKIKEIYSKEISNISFSTSKEELKNRYKLAGRYISSLKNIRCYYCCCVLEENEVLTHTLECAKIFESYLQNEKKRKREEDVVLINDNKLLKKKKRIDG